LQLAQGVEAVQARHLQVEQQEVRVRFGHAPQRLLAITGLADNREAALSLEGEADRIPEDRLIVGQDDPDGRDLPRRRVEHG
jgi:hypothetical protein